MFDVRNNRVSEGSFVIFLSPHSNEYCTDNRVIGRVTQYSTVFYKDTDGEYKEIDCDILENSGALCVLSKSIKETAEDLVAEWGKRQSAILDIKYLGIGEHIKARDGLGEYVYLGNCKSVNVKSGANNLDMSGDAYLTYTRAVMKDEELLNWMNHCFIHSSYIDLNKYYVVGKDKMVLDFLHRHTTGAKFEYTSGSESCCISYHSEPCIGEKLNVWKAKEGDLVYVIKDGKTLNQGTYGVYLADGSVFTQDGTLTKDFVYIVITCFTEVDTTTKYRLQEKYKRISRQKDGPSYEL